MDNKAILKNRDLILEKMIENNKNIEDILNWIKQKLIERGLSDTKVIDEIILGLKNENKKIKLIKSSNI